MRFGKPRGGTRRGPLTDAEVEALERDLAASVDRFREATRGVTGDQWSQSAPEIADSTSPRRDSPFPRIDEDAGPWHIPVEGEPAAAPVGAKPSAVMPAALVAAPVDTAALRRAVDAAADRLREYLVGVVDLLNARPSGIARVYSLGPGAEIGALLWREGFIDYRDPRYEAAENAGSFTLHGTLFAPGSVTLAVMPAAAPTAIEKLMRHDLAFAVREGGGMLVDAGEVAFAVERLVRVRLDFRPDYEHGCITLAARNLDSLGSRLYAIDPAALDATALRSIADFIVGTRLNVPPILAPAPLP